MSVRVTKLVYDCVEETESCFVIKGLDNLLENVSSLSLFVTLIICTSLVSLPVSYEKDYRTDHIGVNPPSSIDCLLTRFHLAANFLYKLLISSSSIRFEVLPQIHQR